MRRSIGLGLSLMLLGSSSIALSAENRSPERQISIAQSAAPDQEATQLLQQAVQYYRQGSYRPALQTYQKLLTLQQAKKNQAGIAQALNGLGETYIGLMDYDKALEVLQQALTMRRQLNDRASEGETLDTIGFATFQKNQYDKALEILQQALAIRREVKDSLGEAKTLKNLGGLYTFGFNQYAKALETLQQALAIQEKLGDSFQKNRTVSYIATAYRNAGDYPKALEWAQKALVLSREIRDRNQEATALIVLGSIYQYQNQFDLARQQYQQAISIVHQLEIYAREHQVIQLIGFSYQSNLSKAIEVDQQSLTFARQHQLRPQELDSMHNLLLMYRQDASIAMAKGSNSQAKADSTRMLEIGQAALPLARELKDSIVESDVLQNIAFAYYWLEDMQKAEIAAQQSLQIARSIKNLGAEQSALDALGSIYGNQGNLFKEIEIYSRQAEIAKARNDTPRLASNLSSLGFSYLNIGNSQSAIETFQQALAAYRQIKPEQLATALRDDWLNLELKAMGGLSRSYASRGAFEQAIEIATQRIKTAQDLKKPDSEAEGLIALAELYNNNANDPTKGIETARQALPIAQQLQDPSLESEALQKIAKGYQKLGQYAPALKAENQILQIAKQYDNPTIEWHGLYLLSETYQDQGNLKQALTVAQQLVTLTQQKLPSYESTALGSLFLRYIALGDTQHAYDTVQQQSALGKRTNNTVTKTLALLGLGQVYKLRGEYNQGIAALQGAMQLATQTGNFQFDGSQDLAAIYEALGDYQKLVEVIEPQLPKVQERRNRPLEARYLSFLGFSYSKLGDSAKGKAMVEQGLAIARDLKNPVLESQVLNNLTGVYSDRGDYSKALELAQQSLQLVQSFNSPALQTRSLNYLGLIYNSLGDYTKSQDAYQRAFETFKQTSNRNGQSEMLLNLAEVSFKQNNPKQAVEQAKESLALAEAIKEPRLAAFAQRMIAIGYGQLSDDARSMTAAQAFLTFTRNNRNPAWEKLALTLVTELHAKFGRNDQAIATYNQALAIQSDRDSIGADAYIYAGLAQIERDAGKTTEAIAHYKQSINAIKQVRQNLQGLPPSLKASFLQANIGFNQRKVSDIYRELADLLLKQGRLSEAQQVRELLTDQELKETRSTETAPKPQIGLTPEEERLRQKYGTLVALGQKLTECQQSKQSCSPLIRDRDQAAQQYYDTVHSIDAQLDDRRGKDREFLDPRSEFGSKARELLQQQPDSALVYILVQDDKLFLLMASKGDLLQKFEVPVDRKELTQTVEDFRNFLQQPSSDKLLKQTSQKLYSWLIQPLEKELQAAQVHHLVFALDRVTRYIPMAALYDGKQYLIERYSVANILSAAKTDFTSRLPNDRRSIKVLGMGLSNQATITQPISASFDALNGVSPELNAIVRQNRGESGIFAGQRFLNQSFTLDSLRDNLDGHQIVHLATHGVFIGDRPESSFILLGDGQPFTIRNVESMQGLSNVHLITLSACETALGGALNPDGLEIQGVSSYFLGKAKSVLATLWKVNDSSTPQAMQAFYQQIASSDTISEAEALRQAQLSLLHGHRSNTKDAKQRDIIIQPSPGTQPRQDPPTNYAHPYYWAPFTLIGNSL